jgi:hypothetical protein
MSKGLILGSSKGLSLDQLYPWASSASETGNRVVLLNMDGESNKMLSLQLKGIGIEVRDVVSDNTLSPHNARFVAQHEYLSRARRGILCNHRC